MASTGNDFAQRTRHLEERIADPRSTISIDSLLDSIVALVYDSEGLKKTKNFDSFYTKCKHDRSFLCPEETDVVVSFSSCINTGNSR